MKNSQWSLPTRYVIGVILLVALIALLIYAHQAVKMLVIAAFISYLISPAVSLLVRHTKLSRKVAVNIVYFTALILLVGIPATLTPIFFDEIKIVVSDLLDFSRQVNAWATQPLQFGGMTFHFEQVARSFAQTQESILTPLPEEALAWLESTSINTLWFLVILVSVHLFMSEWPLIRDWLVTLPPQAYHQDALELYKRIRRVWMAYLRGQIVLMLVVGISFTIAWFIIGIPGALVLGVVAGFFTLVPDVGPLVAALLAISVALLEGSSWIPLPNIWVAGIVTVTYLVLINLKNFFVRPIIMGRSLQMNEALVFISIIMATILEGVMGALLIVPLLASVVVIVEYLRRRIMGLPAFADGDQKFVMSSGKEPHHRQLFFPRKRKRKQNS